MLARAQEYTYKVQDEVLGNFEKWKGNPSQIAWTDTANGQCQQPGDVVQLIYSFFYYRNMSIRPIRHELHARGIVDSYPYAPFGNPSQMHPEV
jgi:hypothetical protein